MDLLRMLSMMMVTMLHALGKSNLLVPMSQAASINEWVAWILECLSVGAVDIFMLISGYFLIQSQFKLGRLIELILQAFFYSFGAFFVFWAMGKVTPEQMDVYQILQYSLPVHMDVYWFVTAYIGLYLLLPVISAGVKNISQKQLGSAILFLLAYECLIKSVLPVRLAEDARGYSLFWYVILFMMGAYVKLYGFPVIKKAWMGWIVFLAGTAGIFAESFILYLIHARTGRLAEMVRISQDYNHILVLLASLGIFAAFLQGRQVSQGAGSVICALSPMALGVYLFQENLLLRYEWQKWFGLAEDALKEPQGMFLCRLIGAVLCMYALGTAVDFLRRLLFRFCGKGFMSMIGRCKEGKMG